MNLRHGTPRNHRSIRRPPPGRPRRIHQDAHLPYEHVQVLLSGRRRSPHGNRLRRSRCCCTQRPQRHLQPPEQPHAQRCRTAVIGVGRIGRCGILCERHGGNYNDIPGLDKRRPTLVVLPPFVRRLGALHPRNPARHGGAPSKWTTSIIWMPSWNARVDASPG